MDSFCFFLSFSPLKLFLWFAGPKRDEEPSGEKVLRLIQIRLALTRHSTADGDRSVYRTLVQQVSPNSSRPTGLALQHQRLSAQCLSTFFHYDAAGNVIETHEHA